MKLNLLYYKNVLDLAVEEYISKNEKSFVAEDGTYVLGKQAEGKKLEDELESCVVHAIKKIVDNADGSNDKLLLIGSCYPKDNLLMQFRDKSYFPKKLEDLIASKPNIKWMLREHDIKIGIDAVNDAFVKIFNHMFSDSGYAAKAFREGFPNLIPVMHSRLDCYMMFKTIKWMYGASNCRNLWKEKFVGNFRSNLVAVNDMIHKYVKNKVELNQSAMLKQCVRETNVYLDSKLGM